MVKSLLLALTMHLVYAIAVTFLFRACAIKRRAAAMVRLFLLTLPVFSAVYILTPADLGFLPEGLTEPILWVDLGFSWLLYGAGFFGGILQLYNLADRGFSLRIVMDIAEAREGAMTVDEIVAGYSAGKGLAWMYQKRLEGLLEHELITLEKDWVRNTEKGHRAAAVFGWLRRFLQLEREMTAQAAQAPKNAAQNTDKDAA